MQDDNNITSLSQAHRCCASALWPCKKCTVYACDYANVHTVTWLSFMAICRSACDRSRSCQRSSLWDNAVMNLSTPPTGMFSVSWRQRWQLVASALLSCRNFRSSSFQETRSGQSVNTQTLMSTWKLSNFITVYSRLIFSPSLQNVIQLPHSCGSGLSLTICIRIIATKRKDFIVTIPHPV